MCFTCSVTKFHYGASDLLSSTKCLEKTRRMNRRCKQELAGLVEYRGIRLQLFVGVTRTTDEGRGKCNSQVGWECRMRTKKMSNAYKDKVVAS